MFDILLLIVFLVGLTLCGFYDLRGWSGLSSFVEPLEPPVSRGEYLQERWDSLGATADRIWVR